MKNSKLFGMLSVPLVVLMCFGVFVACSTPVEEVDESQVPEQAQSLDTVLPVYPGAVQTHFLALTETVFNTIYQAPGPFEEVVDFFIQEIGDMEGMEHSEFTYGEGEYQFEFQGGPLEGYPDQNSGFIITLFHDIGEPQTEFQILATYDFFER